MKALKAKYDEEIKSLMDRWDKDKLTTYRDGVSNQMYELRKRQQMELPTLEQVSRRSISVAHRRSAQVTELRKKQESLVVFGKYKEAMIIDRIINNLLSQDSMENKSMVINRLNQNSYTIKKKHKRQLSAMEMKIKNNWATLCNKRQKEIEVLEKWYKNNKKDLELKYKQKKLKLDKLSPKIRMEVKSNISNFT